MKHFAKSPWGFEYEPYTSQEGKEIPNYTVYSSEEEPEHSKVCDTNENTPVEMQEGAAKLIAAAPDLLAALELCLKRLEINNVNGSEMKAMKIASAAITRACYGS